MQLAADPVQQSMRQLQQSMQLAGYLANAACPVPLVLDLRIAHERFGSSSDPNLIGHLHYPNDIDRSLNEAAADKIRKYRSFRSSACAIYQWPVPLPPRGVLLTAQIQGWQHSRQGCSTTDYFECRRSTCSVTISHSPITLANLSSINLVSIFRCSSPPRNPVYARRVDP